MVGLVFWVRADDVGTAAALAVDTARRAGADCGVGPERCDVTIIPRNAVRLPLNDSRLPMLLCQRGVDALASIDPDHSNQARQPFRWLASSAYAAGTASPSGTVGGPESWS